MIKKSQLKASYKKYSSFIYITIYGLDQDIAISNTPFLLEFRIKRAIKKLIKIRRIYNKYFN